MTALASRLTLSKKLYLALDYHDVVIGPSQDGGYYLLGMNTLIPELFQNMPWSTDQVLCSRRLRSFNRKDCYISYYPPLRDVDTLEDWEAEKASFFVNRRSDSNSQLIYSITSF